ncbi:MAG: 3'-5' exonuclease, partial [Chthoniobacterales bacterium]
AGVIQERALQASFRSADVIVDFVNEMFSDLGSVRDILQIPGDAVRAWERAWRDHRVAEAIRDRIGTVRWVAVEDARRAEIGEGESDGPAEASPQDLEVLKILREVEPWKRGLSCAALKRDNKSVIALADLLQAEGIPVTVEGKANPCLDNPLGNAVMVAMRWVASPDDAIAGVMLAGSVLGSALLGGGEKAFREEALRSVASVGFADTVRGWLSRLDLRGEGFLERRGEDLLDAAAAFDADRSAGDGFGEFIAFLSGWRVQESESADVVRVMTVHQAKGLTFDMAVLSGVDTLQRDTTPGSLLLGGGDPREWGLLMPSRDLAEADEALREVRERELAAAYYGTLCTLYVGMTRSRHGLYVITKQLPDTTKAKSLTRWLRSAVGDGFEAGRADWFREVSREVVAPSSETEAVTPRSFVEPRWGTPRPVSPSGLAAMGGAGGGGSHGVEAMAFGTSVHSALADLEWVEPGFVPAFADCDENVRVALTAFFAAAEAEVFAKPAGELRLWRERTFDVVVDGTWMAGVFDRVHVWCNPDGQPVRAMIYDFKTGAPTSGDEHYERYAGQLEAYRRAGAQLLGLRLADVAAEAVIVARVTA